MVTDAEIQEVQKSVADLAGHVMTIAKRVYAKDDKDYDDDEMPYMDDDKKSKSRRMKMDEDDDDKDYMDKHKKSKSRRMKMDEDEDDEEYMDKHKKSKSRSTRKGYDDAAEDRKDEEDASFGETPDSDSKGNEALDPEDAPKSPPFSGDREDETFNVNAMVKSMTELTEAINKMGATTESDDGSQTLVKSMVPEGTARGNGRDAGEGELVTRDMQKEAIGRTYKDLNRLREEVGDLPRNGFLG